MSYSLTVPGSDNPNTIDDLLTEERTVIDQCMNVEHETDYSAAGSETEYHKKEAGRCDFMTHASLPTGTVVRSNEGKIIWTTDRAQLWLQRATIGNAVDLEQMACQRKWYNSASTTVIAVADATWTTVLTLASVNFRDVNQMWRIDAWVNIRAPHDTGGRYKFGVKCYVAASERVIGAAVSETQGVTAGDYTYATFHLFHVGAIPSLSGTGTKNIELEVAQNSGSSQNIATHTSGGMPATSYDVGPRLFAEEIAIEDPSSYGF